MERQIRKNIRLVRNFFADHCKNPDIDVKTTARDEDIGILMGIPFFPDEYVPPPHNFLYQQDLSSTSSSSSSYESEESASENSYMETDQDSEHTDDEHNNGMHRPNDCLAHVAARFQNFAVLRAIVDLFGERVLYQQDDYKIIPLVFLIACRATRTFSQPEQDWIEKITNTNNYGFVSNNIYYYFGIEKLSNFQSSWTVDNNKIYQSYVHLVQCARFHGFLFVNTHQIRTFIHPNHYLLEPIVVLEKALEYLPRERWIERDGGLLNTVMYASQEMSKNNVANVAIESFLKTCIHHFSAEEWKINDINAGHSPASWFCDIRFHKHNNDDYEKGFDEQVLIDAFETFPLLFFKGRYIFYIIVKNLFHIVHALQTLTNRMKDESKETIMQFLAPEYPEHPHMFSFFTAFNRFEMYNGPFKTTTPEIFFSIFRSLFRYHPFLFSIAKEQLDNELYLDLIESLEGEQMVLENVFANLSEGETFENIGEIVNAKQWDHPLIVMDSIVGRNTNAQRSMQTDESRREIQRYRSIHRHPEYEADASMEEAEGNDDEENPYL